MFRQKLYGLAVLAMGIGVPVLTGDATISLLLVPLGIYLIFTTEYWMND